MTRVIVALIGFAIVIPILVWGRAWVAVLRRGGRMLRRICEDGLPERRVLTTPSGCRRSSPRPFGWRERGPCRSPWRVLGWSCSLRWCCRFRRAAETLRGVNEVGLWYPVDRFALELGGVAFWTRARVAVHGVGRGLGERPGAYLVGRRFGRHPLAPTISPKKTREVSLVASLRLLLPSYG